MKFLKLITQLRFSYLDYVWLSAFLVLFTKNKFMLAFLAFIVGILFSIFVGRKVNTKTQEELAKQELAAKNLAAKNKEWQRYANAGEKIKAIKMYRSLFGSTLKEAHDVVEEYMGARW